MIPVKQRQKARLRPRRSFDPSETEIRSGSLDIPQIPEKLLDPYCRPLAHSCELCRLEMGEP